MKTTKAHGIFWRETHQDIPEETNEAKIEDKNDGTLEHAHEDTHGDTHEAEYKYPFEKYLRNTFVYQLIKAFLFDRKPMSGF